MKVFVTGASSGLGQAMAREYAARHGADAQLGLLARRESELTMLAGQLTGAECHVFACDVRDRDALQNAAGEFVARVGAPDVLIANAGISAGTVTGDGRKQATDFAAIVQTNLVAMFDTFDVFLPAMRAAGNGSLVGIASVAGIRGMPGAGAYCASKAAAISYLESLRVELHGSPLRVVTIAPGYIRSDMTAANDFPMPFLMDADAFARRAVDAIERGRSWTVIPWQMGFVGKVLRGLPNVVFDRAFARAPRKKQSL